MDEQIQNVIFDWSGTLVDDLPAAWRATNYVFRQAGLPELTLEQFRAEFCLPFKKFYDRYTPDLPMEQLEQWFHGHFKEVAHLVTELPHARGFLEFCRTRGLRTFVLSSVHPSYYEIQATATGFGELLEHPYVQVYDKRQKIHEIMAAHQLAPRATLFIGDMEHDIETARHGGVWSCAVLTGYNTLHQLRAAEPDLIVEHLGELRQVLTQCDLRLGKYLAEVNVVLPVATVGALIFHPVDRRVLMLRTHKWSNLWGIPGGKIKGGERAEAALRREIREETGLEIGHIRFQLVQDCIQSPEFYRPAHFLLLNYVCEAQAPVAVKLNEEAQEYRWCTMEEALRLPLNTPTRVLLEAVKEGAPRAEP
ncbi:MAG: NUDIX domain-containing protein [Verrucomicrobiae bacterium]|nr:NUDIX domain-containing protein [Verrucomicrobiae bacterium]